MRGRKVSSPLLASVSLCHTGREDLPSFLHQDITKSKGSHIHVWASQVYSSHTEDSPDMVLALEGSQSMRKAQILASHWQLLRKPGGAWPCDQVIFVKFSAFLWLH